MKSILISILVISTALSGAAQSDTTSKKFQIEIGHNYFPRNNVYLGFKKELFNSKKILFRSGIVYSFYPKYKTEQFTETYHNSILSAGLEYHFFNKVKWFSPYVGVDLLNYHETTIRNGNFPQEEKVNAAGAVFVVGAQFKFKKFLLGVEADLGYCYITEYRYINPDLNYDVNSWDSGIFRYPLIYLGYKF